jgi:hypothetical protein
MPMSNAIRNAIPEYSQPNSHFSKTEKKRNEGIKFGYLARIYQRQSLGLIVGAGPESLG